VLPQHTAVLLLNAPDGLGPLALVGQTSAALLWALAIVAFGALLIICVLLLLRRQPGDIDSWDVPDGAGMQTGRYLQHLHRLLRATRAINSVIVTERDRQQLMEKACRTLTTTRGYRMAWIGIADEETQQVKPMASAGVEEGYLDTIRVTWDDTPQGRGPAGRAIKSGEPCVMRDIESAPEFRPWREEALQRGYRSSAALPLRCQASVTGALCVYSDIPDAFDIEEVGLLQEVADHLAYALSAIGLQEELAESKRQARLLEHEHAAFQHTCAGMVATDRDGIITSINPAMIGMLRQACSAEDIVDQRSLLELDVFAAPSDQASIRRMLTDALPVTFTLRASPDDGDGCELLCCGTPIVDAQKGMTGSVWIVAPTACRNPAQ